MRRSPALWRVNEAHAKGNNGEVDRSNPPATSLSQVAQKRRKLDVQGTTDQPRIQHAGLKQAGSQHAHRKWWPSMTENDSWLADVDTSSNSSHFHVQVCGPSRTLASFPNLWDFHSIERTAELDDHLHCESSSTPQKFDVYNLTGNPFKRTDPPDTSFSLYILR